jgi:lipopolysaccharide/colanic/teichoic acid biosynthesis glycosyltransferase
MNHMVFIVFYLISLLLGKFVFNNLSADDYLYSTIIYAFFYIICGKFYPKIYQKKYKYIISPYARAFVFQLIIIALFSIFLNIKSTSHVIIFLLNFIFEAIYLYFLAKNYDPLKDKTTVITSFLQEPLPFSNKISKIDLSKHLVDNGQPIETLQKIDDQLLLENTKINDWFNINKKLSEIYKKAEAGQLLVFYFDSIDITNLNLKNNYGIACKFIFPLHWLFFRVLTKIPFLDKIQNFISRGKSKVLSAVEVNGRLVYNGFTQLHVGQINNTNYIVAQKTHTPSLNPTPSYYLLTRLNRVSLHGNIIKIVKVRSMYPYSEFLQKDVFEQFSLSNSGKINSDPRITPVGKYIRKYWIDEIPQIFEWLSGKIKLVGIRAMSQHYFSLYNKEYQDLYHQVKPGFLSPLFDDNGDFNHIQNVEIDYLKKYTQAPVKTDIEYFLKTVSQIFKGIRSK